MDARESFTRRFRDVAPAVGSRSANPVVEGPGTQPYRSANHYPTYHPGGFVRRAEVVIDAGYRERNLEVITGMHQKSRVPGHRTLGNSQGVMIVPRVISRRRVHILTRDPAHGHTRIQVESDRIEPNVRPNGVAAHLDHFDSARQTKQNVRQELEAGENHPAGFQEVATRLHFTSLTGTRAAATHTTGSRGSAALQRPDDRHCRGCPHGRRAHAPPSNH